MLSRDEDAGATHSTTQLLKWLDKGVFDALQKKYLKTMAFCIFEGSGDRDSSRLLERYMFKITYPASGGYEFDDVTVHTENGESGATMNAKALQTKAVHMIRGLVSLCSTFESLPEERTVSMFLFYHDNVTPRDYEPECFSCVPDGASYISGKEFMNTALSLNLGTLSSKYHCMSMKVKARDENVRDENLQARDSSVNIEMTEEETEYEDATSICMSQDEEEQDIRQDTTKHQEITMTIDSEAQEDEDFQDLPPWRKSRVLVCRAIVAIFTSSDFANTR